MDVSGYGHRCADVGFYNVLAIDLEGTRPVTG